MKTKYYLSIIAAGLLVMGACEELPEGPFLKSTANIVRPDITAPAGGTSYTLTEATQNNVMTTFKWNAPDFGFQAAVTYTLQVTITNDFKDANDLGVTNKTELEVLNSKMNTTLLILGAEPDVNATLKCRVKAVINPNVPVVYSDTVSLTVKPFEVVINYPKLYVPGSYQGWNPANEETVITSAKSDEKYEGFLYFPDANTEFKLLKVPAWEEANTIGDPDPSGTSGTLQIGSWGGNNIKVSGGPGYFRIKANLNEATYEWVKTTWSVIGDATPGGWSSDTPMTYSTSEKVWTVTLNLTGGKAFKFRANNDWAINLGDTGGDKKLEYGGDNIPVAADGNYTITLDLSKTIYKYKIVKN